MRSSSVAGSTTTGRRRPVRDPRRRGANLVRARLWHTPTGPTTAPSTMSSGRSDVLRPTACRRCSTSTTRTSGRIRVARTHPRPGPESTTSMSSRTNSAPTPPRSCNSSTMRACSLTWCRSATRRTAGCSTSRRTRLGPRSSAVRGGHRRSAGGRRVDRPGHRGRAPRRPARERARVVRAGGPRRTHRLRRDRSVVLPAVEPLLDRRTGSAVQSLADAYGKEVLIVETGYPWTHDDAGDSADNVLDQASGYDISPAGQAAFMSDLTASWSPTGAGHRLLGAGVVEHLLPDAMGAGLALGERHAVRLRREDPHRRRYLAGNYERATADRRRRAVTARKATQPTARRPDRGLRSPTTRASRSRRRSPATSNDRQARDPGDRRPRTSVATPADARTTSPTMTARSC